ncbi:MAG: chromosomal replication initiator protein [Pseudohongiellaceae bacterium]|jgi:chromosomal replication initiator protein
MVMDGIGCDIWLAVAESFRRLRGVAAHDLWLGRAEPSSFRRGLFTLGVENNDVKAALDGPYRDDLESIFREITGSPVRLRTELVSASDSQSNRLPEMLPGALPASRETMARRRAAKSESKAAQTAKNTAAVPVADLDLTVLPESSSPTPAGLLMPSFSAVVRQQAMVDTAAHRLVLRATEGWVDDPAGGFNPLFIHGPAGSGKTALAVHALARLSQAHPELDPLVVSGESLAADVSAASRSRTFGRLQRSWADRDVLVIDEAHRLRNRYTTQSMVVSLVEPVLRRGGRVLVLSRHPPGDIFALSDRLLSHFLAGMVVALREPDPASRRAVLASVAAVLPVGVEEGVTSAVAEHCPGSLADAIDLLRGAADRAAREGRTVERNDVQLQLRQPSPMDRRLDDLIAMLAEETGIEAERIRSAEKSRDVAAVRHLCVYMSSHSLGLSSRRICRSLRLRSPSIVAYARRAVDRRRRLDAEYEQLVQRVQGRLEGAQRDLEW